MAVDKSVDSAQLDAALSAVADAIRSKGGTEAALSFPAGFVSAIDAIPTGGGGQFELLTSGSYTQASDGTTMTIPFSTTGTPLLAYVEADAPISGVGQGVAWISGNVSQISQDASSMFPQFALVRSRQANGNLVAPGAPIGLTQKTYGLHDDYILCAQTGSSYPIKANTYNWYVGGVSA